MHKGKSLLLIFLILAFSTLVHAQENYRLGPEDELEIRVWDHEDLKRTVRVGLDGCFSFPFVGEVNAKGMSLLELKKELERRLADGYIIDPHVSINVTEVKSQKFFVVGKVQKPGTYPLTKPITVTEAISLAGGLTQEGDKSVKGGIAYLVRPRPGEKPTGPRAPLQSGTGETFTISLEPAFAGDPKHNLEIKNGDTLNVPRLNFYITGEVKKPGRYPFEDHMTVLMGVTTAEGFTDKASSRSTYIIRDKTGNKQKIPVKMQDPIQPGDTIVVPESFF
jgi:polysaccharide export outer membrane protein